MEVSKEFSFSSSRFKTFGGRDPHRPAEDIAYSVARFFQKGGSVHNYYMVSDDNITYFLQKMRKFVSSASQLNPLPFIFVCKFVVVSRRNEFWTYFRRTIHHNKL